jgi:uncharacterized membrane protein YecN with MAPEG domain
MSVSLWVLLGFAAWTLLIVAVGLGYERWSRILKGESGPADFPADQPHGSDRYRRIVRAHANCVENLPVYGAIAIAVTASGASGGLVSGLAVAFLIARVLQTGVHIGFRQTHRVVGFRATFFSIQVGCMFGLAVLAALAATG